MIRHLRSKLSATLLLAALGAVSAYSEPIVEPQLKAGAYKIDITPPVDQLPAPLISVHDPLFVRALVLESNNADAIIVTVDAPAISSEIYQDILETISNTFDVPRRNIVLSVTHTHNSMRVANPGPSPIPTSAQFTADVRTQTIAAIKEARQRLTPSKYGFGSSQSSLVVGRNEWYAPQNRYIDGTDRTGMEPVDKTFGVLVFKKLSGEPIATVANFGIQPVVFEPANTEVSGDVPGVTSNYVEAAIGGDFVSLFTIGAPASPAYRVWFNDDPTRTTTTAERILSAMGVILGEEVLAQMDAVTTSADATKIRSATSSLTCPGKITTPRNLRTHCAYTDDSDLPACKFTDQPYQDVLLNLGVLRLGDLTFVTSDSNVTPALWQKFKSQSSLSSPMLVNTNFGQFRFVVDEKAYALSTYPATDTRAQAHCAENGFLETVGDLIRATE